MNYQHAYHAGNFADCFKHALLVTLLEALLRKPKAFFVLDTHAGAGRHDLASAAALRTREFAFGIGRLLGSQAEPLQHYLGLVKEIGLYPGSPALIARLLRAQDRLACCDVQPEALRALRSFFHADRRVHVHQRSGWEALGALLPPKERRGLVFIDPPFEDADEFSTLARGLVGASRRFGQGIHAGWYPIKRRHAVRLLHQNLAGSGVRDVVAVEMCLREPTDPNRLNGCGLAVINPPHLFEERAGEIAGAVLDGIGPREDGSRAEVVRLADE